MREHQQQRGADVRERVQRNPQRPAAHHVLQRQLRSALVPLIARRRLAVRLPESLPLHRRVRQPRREDPIVSNGRHAVLNHQPEVQHHVQEVPGHGRHLRRCRRVQLPRRLVRRQESLLRRRQHEGVA